MSLIAYKQVAITAASPLLLDFVGNLSEDPTVRYTVNGLTTTGDILMTNATSSSISANKVLNLIQKGDTYGTSYLTLANGNPACGIEVRTTHPTVTLAEIFLTTSTYSRVIRQESRSGSARDSKFGSW